MVHSMTAYANRDTKIKGGVVQCEIRSVNHRYLELSFKLPDPLRHLENLLRDVARKFINRGKVECILKFDWEDTQAKGLIIDNKLVDDLILACVKVEDQMQKYLQSYQKLTISPLDILRWPSVVRNSMETITDLAEPIEQAFELTLQDLIKVRAREGEKLDVFVQSRLLKMHERVNKIYQRLPEIQQEFRTKFQTKLTELQLQIDQNRFEQEMVYLIQKMDISEELDRLNTHLEEVERVLKSDKVVGRRLDFLMQELNREANTVGSKAMDNASIQDAVELKVLIEEMREQIQNLE